MIEYLGTGKVVFAAHSFINRPLKLNHKANNLVSNINASNKQSLLEIIFFAVKVMIFKTLIVYSIELKNLLKAAVS